MQLNQLKRNTVRKYEKRVGRGGKRGKTSGRGTKGQKARAGHRIRPDIREKLKKIPKLRGYSFKSLEGFTSAVNVSVLEKHFAAGETVNPKILMEKGLARARGSNVVKIKILGDGDLHKKLVISGCAVSKPARAKIEAAGGSIA